MSAERQTNLLKCEICNKMLKSITGSHLRTHNITGREYKKMYPDAKLISDEHYAKLAKWIHSEENKIHCLNLLPEQHNSQKRKDAAKKVVQSAEYRNNHSKRMKQYVAEHPESVMWKSIKGEAHHHYGKSNWQRWFEKYGKEEADRRFADYKTKCKVPFLSKSTSIEILVKNILDKNNIEYIHQYKNVSKFFIDFYIPKINLALEIHGDYWHANPSRYKADEYIKYPGNRLLMASDIWNRDATRLKEIESLGYNVDYIFGSEITEITILSIINKFDKDIVRTYEKS